MIENNQQEIEIWKDVPGYEGMYQVSDIGNIKSLNYNKTKKEKLLKKWLDKDGYYECGLFKKGNLKKFRINQLVAMAFYGHVPCGLKKVVNHKNFTRHDNRLENLEVVTSRKNSDRKHLPSTSKYTGVYWDKRSKKWASTIYFNLKNISLGAFDTEEEASEYYENALKSIENGEEIKRKPALKTSKYIGVSFIKRSKKWASYIQVNKKSISLGFFKTEEEAYNSRCMYEKENNINRKNK